MENYLFQQPEPKIIPVWLRDTYARVQPNGLFTLEGYNTRTDEVVEIAENSILAGFSAPNFFLQGSNIFAYLNRTLNSNICNQTITLVVQGLRDLYWNNRDRLIRENKLVPVDQAMPDVLEDEILALENAMKRPLPSFTNIFNYASLRPLREKTLVPMFQVYGDITSYDVVQIPVKYFLESINAGIPISIELEGINIIFQFSYKEYDFWDPEAKQIINTIDLNRCNE